MSFLIDTDTASEYIRGVGIVQNRFLQHTGRLHVSTVTLAELQVWLRRKNTARKFVAEMLVMQKQIQLLTVDDTVADKAGEIGANHLDAGLSIATPDLLIAATALLHGLTLVTHNTQDYVHVAGLVLVDWLIP